MTQVKLYQDNKKQAIYDLFPKMEHGQINISFIPPNKQINAWHSHDYLDYWFLLQGSLKVGIATTHDEKNFTVEFIYLSDKNLQILELPHRSYHGYMNIGHKEAILLYWLDEKYKVGNTDFIGPGAFNEDWYA